MEQCAYVPELNNEIVSTVQHVLAVVRLKNSGIVQFLCTLSTAAQEAQMEQKYSAMMACCKQAAMCGAPVGNGRCRGKHVGKAFRSRSTNDNGSTSSWVCIPFHQPEHDPFRVK